jgi:hypothetical protein
MNTSNGPVVVDPNPPRHINTSRVTDEDMRYEDEEEEIISVVPAARWCAVVGGEVVALVAFVALDSGRMYGVVLGDDGRVDLVEGDAEAREGFARYEHINDTEEK